METRKRLRQGKKTIVVREYQTDGVVLKALLDVARQAALETGGWQEKQAHRLEKPEHTDLGGMTAELCIERLSAIQHIENKCIYSQ